MTNIPKITKANGHIVQSDWAQNDSTKFDYIHNKPTKLSDFENDENFARYNANGELIVGTTPTSPNAAVPFGYVTGELAGLAELIDNGVGKKTPEGGEIFNDYTSNIASGEYSHAEGGNTRATADMAHSEGLNTGATGGASHSEGIGTEAKGMASHAEGNSALVLGNAAHAEGAMTYASGESAHTEGSYTYALGISAHSEGSHTLAVGTQAHAEGFGTSINIIITGDANATVYTVTSTTNIGTDDYIVCIDSNNNFASSIAKITAYNTTDKTITVSSTLSTSALSNAPAKVFKATAIGNYSHSEGYNTQAIGTAAHAEGYSTNATGSYAHTEGQATTASNTAAHAEGQLSTASGTCSHAEGYYTQAQASTAHAEGYQTQVTQKGTKGAHAEGVGTIANGPSQHVQGKYNIADTTSAHIVGNGTSTSARSNAHTVDWDGNAWYAGDIRVGGTNYATGIPVMYHPNLLINGNFRINQRGQKSYNNTNAPTNTYTVDRWIHYVAGTYTMTPKANGGVTIVNSGSGAVEFAQIIEDGINLLGGKTVTASASVDGTVYSVTGVLNSEKAIPVTLKNSSSTAVGNLYIQRTANAYKVWIKVLGKKTINLDYVKLEIGPVATPYSPRPYGEELALCQRYYQVINMPNKFLSLQESGSSSYIYVQLPVNPNVATYSTPVITNNGCMGSSGSGSSSDVTFPYSTCYYDAKDPSIMIRLSGGSQLPISPILLTGFGSIGIETEIK